MGMDGVNNAVIPGKATPEDYVAEITRANEGIINQRTVYQTASRGYEMVRRLERYGVKFAIAVGPLVAAVSDPHANVRKAAVTALAPMRAYPGATEALHTAASDGDADVRAYARYAVDGAHGHG